MNFLYVTDRSWAIDAFLEHRSKLNGNWVLITNMQDLETVLRAIDPTYIFFPHWSHKVPENIVARHDCVCFHMTDLPFGRGGSPLQNLIVRGYKRTILTSLKMDVEFDNGPIYLKNELNLDGSAQQIFRRMSNLIMKQINTIISEHPTPYPQAEGNFETFTRRKNKDSDISGLNCLESIFDHIRMLDASGYPHAYISHGDLRYEFRAVEKSADGRSLSAKVDISKSNKLKS
jgi:methionyl-tRNA formyltransferase